jgi:hypothetical protein
MQWIRTRRRFGAWCALAAIALQILMSFGHTHRIGFRLVGLVPGVAAVHAVAEPGDPASNGAGLAAEYCAICAVIKMEASAVPPEAPVAGVPVVAGRVQFAPQAEAAASALADLLFQARAPPSA